MQNPQHTHTHARHNTFMAERICSKGLHTRTHTHMQGGACLPPRWVWHLFYAYFSLRSHKGLTPPLPLLPSWGNTWAIKVKYAKMKIYNFLWAFAATPGPCCHIMLPFLCCACLDSRVLFALLSCLALYFGTNLVPLPRGALPLRLFAICCGSPGLAKFAQFLRFRICTNYILLFYSFTICRRSAAIKVAFAVLAHWII